MSLDLYQHRLDLADEPALAGRLGDGPAERPCDAGSVTKGGAEEAAPQRVAYVVGQFDVGGLERCVAHLVNQLDRERFSPLVICLNGCGTAADWVEVDCPIHELQSRGGNDWRLVRRLAHLLRQERVDVVHSHNWGTLIETTIARRLAGTPSHVHAQHGLFFHGRNAPNWKKRLRRLATRWAIRRLDSLVTVSEPTREEWSHEKGVRASVLTVIENGVSVPQHDASGEESRLLKDSLGIPSSACVAGSVGRLVPVKAFERLIDVLSSSLLSDWHVVIVGDGPERSRLMERAAGVGVSDRCHFVGQQKNVGDWLAAMDVYINCSRSEAMSISILEAMAMGLPLVVTDVGGNSELVGRDDSRGPIDPCGRIVDADDREAFAVAIAAFGEASLKAEAGQLAHDRHGARYSVGTMVTAYEQLYESITVPSVGRSSSANGLSHSKTDDVALSLGDGTVK